MTYQEGKVGGYSNQFVIETFIKPLGRLSEYMDKGKILESLEIMRNLIVRLPPPLNVELAKIKERIEDYLSTIRKIRAFNWNQRDFRINRSLQVRGKKLANEAYEWIWDTIYDESFFEQIKRYGWLDTREMTKYA